ncbi:MAG: tetratricopeptide repeat protein [Solirubrobacterales bacterium]|nr:tetratricopeptide repeat protein [Solirubrobacterales bacterium]
MADLGEAALGNLPQQLTRLVDRRQALAELRALIWRTRLLTLSGPGGAGKTRLAAALAEVVRADLVGGAWWVDLSASVDSGAVAQIVASTLLPGEASDDPASFRIARRLGDTSLLVLDNCDQVIDGCAELVADLLARPQSLRVIATSRQALGVPGEQVFRVAGLAVERPSASEGGEDEASRSGAVELFIERAREASSSFDPDAPGVRETIVRICTWLDGMPLAIELAAGRVPTLGVAQIAERLEHDASFLRRPGRAAPARHGTLQDMLEWSHRMLEPAEQQLFRRLSSFRGSFSLEGAEAVCADDALPAGQVLDLLSVLVERSLVQVVEHGAQTRYRLMAIVRQYAATKLAQSSGGVQILERHASFFYRLAEQAERGWATGDEARWLELLELDHDNLVDALHWYVTYEAPRAARLAVMLWPFWYQRGYYREARGWFERVLATGAELPAHARVDVLIKAGEVAFLACDYRLATDHLQRALSLEPDDRRAVAMALQRLGSIAREQGRYDEARDLHKRGRAIWIELEDSRGIAAAQNYLGFVEWLSGHSTAAEALCSEALSGFERAGGLQETAETLISLGAAALYGDDVPLAAERFERALSISRRLGFQEGIAWCLHELAIVGRRRRQPLRELAMMLRDALLVHRQLGDRWRVASVLEEIAGAVLARQAPRLAVGALAAADALRESLGTPVPPAESADREAALSRCGRRLSKVAFAGAWIEGRARELDDTIELVVDAIERLAGSDTEPSDRQGTPILTPRELAVLERLTEGQTNREIAAALYMSPSTAGVHVSNILRKLGAKRRVDAAGIAHALGLLSGGEASPAPTKAPV